MTEIMQQADTHSRTKGGKFREARGVNRPGQRAMIADHAKMMLEQMSVLRGAGWTYHRPAGAMYFIPPAGGEALHIHAAMQELTRQMWPSLPAHERSEFESFVAGTAFPQPAVAQESGTQEERPKRVFEVLFINAAPAEDIAEATGFPDEIVRGIMQERPFSTETDTWRRVRGLSQARMRPLRTLLRYNTSEEIVASQDQMSFAAFLGAAENA